MKMDLHDAAIDVSSIFRRACTPERSDRHLRVLTIRAPLSLESPLQSSHQPTPDDIAQAFARRLRLRPD